MYSHMTYYPYKLDNFKCFSMFEEYEANEQSIFYVWGGFHK